MAAQASPIAADPTPRIPRSMRVDPTGRVVLPQVPDDLLQRWRDDRAALEAETRILAARIGELRRLVSDSYMVGHNLRGLVYLFEKAVVEDGPDSPLTTASHIVIDCLRSMAARLEALDEQAEATRDVGGAR
ncbi:hypothetical protein MKK63_25175 [Methylobacterium sp. J-088]|uniref:hypothetical protein n=1 Tax=Methylobacterium sp. J-088 TaxID=2836664 RepID=UPI001FB8E38B|nr:hypothetical protein [Methylobacterium sp. J-088]MCJ2065974.1 hypothetical protein [Methylobacterium sp. J-088]